MRSTAFSQTGQNAFASFVRVQYRII